MKKAKKQRIIYKENGAAKAAELEEFLFGAGNDPTALFDREREEGEDTIAELVKQASRKGGLLHDSDLFFEDTRGVSDSSSSSDDDEGAPSGDGDEGSGSGEDEDVDVGRPREGEEGAGAGTKRQRQARGQQARDPKGRLKGAAAEQEEEEDEDGAAGSSDEGGSSGDGEAGDGESSGGEEQEDEEEEEDAAAAARLRSSREAGPAGRGQAGPGRPQARGAAWSDPDDANLVVEVAAKARLRKLRAHDKQTAMDGAEYEAALRKQHAAMNPRTSWAKKRNAAAARAGGDDEADGAATDDDDDVGGDASALLARAGGLVVRGDGRSERLPAGQLETTRLKDANQHQRSEAVVQAVRFHPNGQLLLTAGLDKKLRLFQVDGLRNPLLQGVHLDDMPLHNASFAAAEPGPSAAADRVVLTGRRPFFYVYDMGAGRVERVAGCPGLKSLESFVVSPPGSSSPSSEPLVAFCGDGGAIPLVSLRSRQWVASLRMSGNVRAMAFARDGLELFSTGDDGVVHVWDLRTRRCRLAFADRGNIRDASSLALSPNGRYVATGSKSGVVNVYGMADVERAAAAGGAARVAVDPQRELLNLTTDVDTLLFSPDSQMLAFASRMKRDALRLAHLPSLTVFSNWPTGRSPLHYVHSLDFSPRCGLLAIGNAKGRALLYRLHHYQQA